MGKGQISRQEMAYDQFKTTATNLLRHDGHLEAASELEEIFTWPGIKDCLQQAFSNILWDVDELKDKQFAGELEMIIRVIEHIADPYNENTQKIIYTLREMSKEDEQKPEVMTQEEIDAEIGNDNGEEDNTPLI